MEVFETIPKRWGNSLGVTIPKPVAEKGHLSTKKKVIIMLIDPVAADLRSVFGTLKLKKPTQQVMEEIDEGYD